MFCSCDNLTNIDKKSFRRTSFKCDDCDTTIPFLIEYTNECVENCGNSYKLIGEEKICVENCDETDYKYLIEKENNDINKNNGKEKDKVKNRGAFRKFLFFNNNNNKNNVSLDNSPFLGRNNFRRSSLQNPTMNSIKERMSGKKQCDSPSRSRSGSSSSQSSSFSEKMNNIKNKKNQKSKDKKYREEKEKTKEIQKEKEKEKQNQKEEIENEYNKVNSKKSTKVNSKETEEDNNENHEEELKENIEEEEQEEIDDTKGVEVDNRIMSPNNDLNLKVSNSLNLPKIPGMSDHLLNHMSKRINHILTSSKINQFNLEDYKYYRRLGEGSYGVIHCLIHEKTKEKYALKKIIAYSLNKIQEFTKEFELVHICQHPNILKIYGLNINILDQTTYSLQVLMEKAERDWDRDIKRRLQERKYYTEEELISIMRQLTSALLFMKEKLNITHRDIKPQNVLIFEGGIYKLADFGEAKEIKVMKNINTLRGTELYMSPALYNGLKINKDDVVHDPFKSDLFSLGFCLVYAATMNFNLLYELRNLNDDEKIKKKIKGQLKDNYSEKFIEIISKMVELDENNRFDFKELSNEVEKYYGK
jgi:hypothetical protein